MVASLPTYVNLSVMATLLGTFITGPTYFFLKGSRAHRGVSAILHRFAHPRVASDPHALFVCRLDYIYYLSMLRVCIMYCITMCISPPLAPVEARFHVEVCSAARVPVDRA